MAHPQNDNNLTSHECDAVEKSRLELVLLRHNVELLETQRKQTHRYRIWIFVKDMVGVLAAIAALVTAIVTLVFSKNEYVVAKQELADTLKEKSRLDSQLQKEREENTDLTSKNYVLTDKNDKLQENYTRLKADAEAQDKKIQYLRDQEKETSRQLTNSRSRLEEALQALAPDIRTNTAKSVEFVISALSVTVLDDDRDDAVAKIVLSSMLGKNIGSLVDHLYNNEMGVWYASRDSYFNPETCVTDYLENAIGFRSQDETGLLNAVWHFRIDTVVKAAEVHTAGAIIEHRTESSDIIFRWLVVVDDAKLQVLGHGMESGSFDIPVMRCLIPQPSEVYCLQGCDKFVKSISIDSAPAVLGVPPGKLYDALISGYSKDDYVGRTLQRKLLAQ